MHSDPDSGKPRPGGADDEVWRDLVARLEEVEDSFLDSPGSPAPRPAPGAPADEPGTKGVTDFDPLGVWQRQQTPAERPDPDHTPAATREAATGPRDYATEDADEDFVPGDLPPLGNAEPAIVLSWIGAAGGPIFLIIAAIFWRQIPPLMVSGVIAAFIAGTGYLLYRLPNHRDHDSGDGAVV